MNLYPEDRKRNGIRSVKSKRTYIEVLFSKALYRMGFRYRLNDKSVFGKPDIVFRKRKIAVFIDGDFWHGRNWVIRKLDHKSNVEFWIRKIERNMERDIKVNEYLKARSWSVIRLWGKDVVKDLDKCIRLVIEEINRKNYE